MSLLYLLRKIMKNRILEIFRKPAVLILYLAIIAVIVALFISSLFAQNAAESFVDIIWLKGMFFALALLYFILAISKGLKSGDVIFGMNDANFLFVSPINPRAILLYGVVRMMGMAFLAGFFILFQSQNLGMMFGTHFGHLLLILLMFILTVSIMQALSLLIYSFTNSKPKAKRLVRVLAFALFAPIVALAAWEVLVQGADLMTAAESLLRSPVLSWLPIVGWSASAVFYFVYGPTLVGFAFLGAMIALGVVLILIIIFSNPDYYEDVLVATETAFERRRALEEGTISATDIGVAGKKIKVVTKPLGGSGASALFYKHMRESFRASPLGIWSMWSIFLVVAMAGVAVIIRLTGGDGGDGGAVMTTLLQVVMWVQIFLIATGRGMSELSSHYIYMLPTSAFAKLVASNWEAVFKVTVESLIIFGVSGAILGAAPPLIIAVALAYISFSLMLIAVNYMLLRITGIIVKAGILTAIYFGAVIIIILPGLIPAIIIGSIWGAAIGTGILALWQTLAALVCFWLSRGILHRCDMPSKNVWKT